MLFMRNWNVTATTLLDLCVSSMTEIQKSSRLCKISHSSFEYRVLDWYSTFVNVFCKTLSLARHLWKKRKMARKDPRYPFPCLHIRLNMFSTYNLYRCALSSLPRFLCHRCKRWKTFRMRFNVSIPSPPALVSEFDSKRIIIACCMFEASVCHPPETAIPWSKRKFSS